MNKKTVTIAIVGVMAALGAAAYMLLPEIPLVPGVGHLKIDISAITVVLTGVVFGIPAGFAVSVIKNLIHLTVSTTFGVGELMDVIIGVSMVITMRLIINAYKKRKGTHSISAAGYYAASAACIVSTVVVGWLANLALTPVFYSLAGFPLTTELLMAGVWGSTLLNVVKAVIVTLPFYPIAKLMEKQISKIGY